jgi:hypothetical protein
MVASEWPVCTNPLAMIDALPQDFSSRKLRLFCCACCRRIWDLLDETCRRTVEVSELYADGLVGENELCLAYEAAFTRAQAISHANGRAHVALDNTLKARGASCEEVEDAFQVFAKTAYKTLNFAGAYAAAYSAGRSGAPYVADQVADAAAGYSAAPGDDYRDGDRYVSELTAIADVLREIIGNPFRPITLDPAWLPPKVKTLAQTIYNNRAFERLPELADALAEAGCSNPDILSHCRGPGPHVRGCWVVDQFLIHDSEGNTRV